MDYREKVKAQHDKLPRVAGGFVKAGDILKLTAMNPQDGDTWGRWRFDEKRRLLLIAPYPGVENYYEVDLHHMEDTRVEIGWIHQISGKTWASAEDIGNLVWAIRDILGMFC
jgi:hypothetical protein